MIQTNYNIVLVHDGNLKVNKLSAKEAAQAVKEKEGTKFSISLYLKQVH